MTYAGFWRRFLALSVDISLLVPLYVLFFIADSRSRPASVALLILIALVVWVYHVYFVGRWGKTIGKSVLGLRVLSEDGKPVGWAQAFLRQLVNIFTGVISLVGHLIAYSRVSPVAYHGLGWVQRSRMLGRLVPRPFHFTRWVTLAWGFSEVVVLLSNQKKRALHDFIAGTVVVVEKSVETSAF